MKALDMDDCHLRNQTTCGRRNDYRLGQAVESGGGHGGNRSASSAAGPASGRSPATARLDDQLRAVLAQPHPVLDAVRERYALGLDELELVRVQLFEAAADLLLDLGVEFVLGVFSLPVAVAEVELVAERAVRGLLANAPPGLLPHPPRHILHHPLRDVALLLILRRRRRALAHHEQ